MINIGFTNSVGALLIGLWYNWRLPWEFSLDKYPGNFEIFKQTLLCMIVEDFIFHFAHRLFHIKSKWLPLYQMIHKKHHEHL
mmetsp:Transcript_9323/g.15721  ORF Transcript_9323/g.15721 Transcript_9323/m.15721 type:complete len:82 (-) Transcript_9323:404-649(-)